MDETVYNIGNTNARSPGEVRRPSSNTAENSEGRIIRIDNSQLQTRENRQRHSDRIILKDITNTIYKK